MNDKYYLYQVSVSITCSLVMRIGNWMQCEIVCDCCHWADVVEPGRRLFARFCFSPILARTRNIFQHFSSNRQLMETVFISLFFQQRTTQRLRFIVLNWISVCTEYKVDKVMCTQEIWTIRAQAIAIWKCKQNQEKEKECDADRMSWRGKKK